jgi:asparagine synthase (glutamine-hydrolysing)
MSGGKRILREAFRDLLPEWIFTDKQKKTFTLPLMKWMRLPRWRQRIHDTLDSTTCRNRGWVDSAVTRNLLERYFRDKDDSKTAWRTSQTVWMLFVLESWAQAHVDQREPILTASLHSL